MPVHTRRRHAQLATQVQNQLFQHRQLLRRRARVLEVPNQTNANPAIVEKVLRSPRTEILPRTAPTVRPLNLTLPTRPDIHRPVRIVHPVPNHEVIPQPVRPAPMTKVMLVHPPRRRRIRCRVMNDNPRPPTTLKSTCWTQRRAVQTHRCRRRRSTRTRRRRRCRILTQRTRRQRRLRRRPTRCVPRRRLAATHHATQNANQADPAAHLMHARASLRDHRELTATAACPRYTCDSERVKGALA